MASPKGKTPWYRDPEKFEELQDKRLKKRRYGPRTTGDDGDELTDSERHATINSGILDAFDIRNIPTERMSAGPAGKRRERYSKFVVPHRFNPITNEEYNRRKAQIKVNEEMRKAAETLVGMKRSRTSVGGKINIYTGPKNGKYIIKNGAKVYINTESLTKPKANAKPKAKANAKPKMR